MAAVFNHAVDDVDPDISRPLSRESVDLFEEFFGYAYRQPTVEDAATEPANAGRTPADQALPDENRTAAGTALSAAADTAPASVMGDVPAHHRPPMPPPAPRIGRFFVQPGGPPPGWRYPATDRRPPEPDPLLEEFGHYVRRARYLVLVSQQILADETGVPQSQISRLERGFAPGLGVSGLVSLGQGIGRALPLGICPHEHTCAWQPIRPIPVHRLGR